MECVVHVPRVLPLLKLHVLTVGQLSHNRGTGRRMPRGAGTFPSVAFEAQWTIRGRIVVRSMDKGKHGKNWSIRTQSICKEVLPYFDTEPDLAAFWQG
jgi:hypothetical protein